MPLYEYRCDRCGRVHEVLQKFSDRPLRKCKICSGRLHKLISRTSFQLKGGGWFAHGYGSGSPGKSSKDGGVSEAGSGASDSKPAKKKSDSSKSD